MKQAKRPIPEIQALKQDGTGWAKAHLRDKAGQLYLQWREGNWVRSVYIGLARSKARSRAGCHDKPKKSDPKRLLDRYGLKTYPAPRG